MKKKKLIKPEVLVGNIEHLKEVSAAGTVSAGCGWVSPGENPGPRETCGYSGA